MLCKKCGAAITENAKFCGHCGAQMDQASKELEEDSPKTDEVISNSYFKCSSCGKTNIQNTPYCPSCGGKLVMVENTKMTKYKEISEKDESNTQRRLRLMAIPRAVRFRPASLWNAYFMLGFFIIVILISVNIPDFFRAASRYFGSDCSALVNNKEIWDTHYRSFTTTNYGLNISYPYPDNTFRVMAPVSFSLFGEIREGANIKIRYIPLLSAYPYIDDVNTAALFITSAAIVFGIIFLCWWLVSTYKLIRVGIPVEGIATAINPNTQGMRTTRLNYSVYLPISVTVQYKLKSTEQCTNFRAQSGDYVVGDRVQLLLDPENPCKGKIYSENYPWELVG